METIAALQEITRRQQHLIAEMNHALHGKRSEKLAEDERQLAFEDLSIALAEVEAEKETHPAKAGESLDQALAQGWFSHSGSALLGACTA